MNSKFIKYALRILWVGFFLAVVGLPSIFYMVKHDSFGWYGGLPSLEALERPDPDLSSELISSDGVSLGKYFRKNRTPVTYEELSPELVNTLLVTEDIRFKKHSGIDLRGLARAIFGKLTFSFRGGGSTITMQLAENLYRTNTSEQGSLYRFRSIGQVITKIKEWIIAVQLEESYTKEEILAMYLNTVEFGSNSYGIKVAAKTFFNKLPVQLNYSESAVLVGAINAPTRWSPVLNPENALRKRTEVLWNLTKYNIIDSIAFDTLNSKPIELSYRVDNQNEGLATYFRTQARNFLINWCKENDYDLFDDGLRIYTTIDSRLQQFAEEAVNEHMDTLQRLFNEHWIDGNPWIDDDNEEIVGFLETTMKRRTKAYRNLARKYEDQEDSIEFYLNLKKEYPFAYHFLKIGIYIHALILVVDIFFFFIENHIGHIYALKVLRVISFLITIFFIAYLMIYNKNRISTIFLLGACSFVTSISIYYYFNIYAISLKFCIVLVVINIYLCAKFQVDTKYGFSDTINFSKIRTSL